MTYVKKKPRTDSRHRSFLFNVSRQDLLYHLKNPGKERRLLSGGVFSLVLGLLFLVYVLSQVIIALNHPEEDANWSNSFRGGSKQEEARLEKDFYMVWCKNSSDPGKVTIRDSDGDLIFSKSSGSAYRNKDGVAYRQVGTLRIKEPGYYSISTQDSGTVYITPYGRDPLPWIGGFCGSMVIGWACLLFFFKNLDGRRVAGLNKAAKKLQLSFYGLDQDNIRQVYGYHHTLSQGEGGRRAQNVIKGMYKGQDILLFDYHYETYGETEDGDVATTHYFFSAGLLCLSGNFPEFFMEPEGLLDKVRMGLFMELEDINFDNPEFSRRYLVRCSSRKFAYAILTPRVMEFILGYGPFSMELEHDTLLVHFPGTLRPEKVVDQLNLLSGLASLFPRYLLVREGEENEGKGQARCIHCGRKLETREEEQLWYCWNCKKYT